MKKLVFVVALFVFAILSANGVNALTISKQDVWSVNNHTYRAYLYNGESRGWETAQNYLVSQGWYLATITTAQEQAFVAGLINPITTSEYWLGASQPALELGSNTNWTWVTGELWDSNVTYWAGGEPNDYSGPGSEQYLAMWGSGTWKALWNDEGAIGNITGFIAERNAPVPEPATMLLLGSGLVGLAGFGRKKLFKRA